MQAIQKESLIETLGQLKDEIIQKYHTEILGLFGSVARGESRSNSDIDILIDFRNEATIIDWIALEEFLEKQLRTKVDLVPVDALKVEMNEYIQRDLIRL
ncbi:MAG: nucleotidyltransferase domain-containing protein [Spirochaetota bacterium]